MQFNDEIAFEDGGVMRQIRRQLEVGRGGDLVIACSEHAAPIASFCRDAGRAGALVLRVPGPDLRRPGVWEAVSLAVSSTSLTAVSVLGHSGSHHALACCPDMPAPVTGVDDDGVMGRLTRGVRQHGRLIDAAQRTVRAAVRALSTMEALKPGLEAGTVRLHGAVLLIDSGVWQHYRPDGDRFVADVDAIAA